MRIFRHAVMTALVAAAPVLFSSEQANAALCSASDVTLTIDGTLYTPSSCASNLAPANQSPATETTAINSALGTSFTYLDKSDDSSSAGIGGIQFTVTAPQGSTGGNWTVSWVDTNGSAPFNLPITIDFGVYLFGGNNGAAYLLSNVLLPITPNTGTGTFDITFTNNGGQIPGLSHMTLIGGNVSSPTPVPEPASLALFGAGLLGLGLARRTARRKDA